MKITDLQKKVVNLFSDGHGGPHVSKCWDGLGPKPTLTRPWLGRFM